PQAENKVDQVVIDFANNLAIERIVAMDFVTLNHIHVIPEHPYQSVQLAWIILGVAVGVEHEVAGRVLKTASQGTAIAPIARMGNDTQPRISTLKLLQDLAGVVSGAVVYDQDFVVIRDVGVF